MQNHSAIYNIIYNIQKLFFVYMAANLVCIMILFYTITLGANSISTHILDSPTSTLALYYVRLMFMSKIRNALVDNVVSALYTD